MASLSSSSRSRACLPRLRALLTFQKFKHTAGDGENNDHMELHNWRKLDSRTFGIRPSMISPGSWTVVKLLQSEGYEAYLVGGCVRDLILKRIPKDFDVITTAPLPKIRNRFNRSIIIGRRFPICRVNIKGSFVEVSCFDTVDRKVKNNLDTMDKKTKKRSNIPAGCDERDVLRWKNCMHRDFTINSLLYDPFDNKIYDYSNALQDLRSLQLRTLVPAQLSFKEDSARILRGLRLAARLNLSFTKETETAIQKLSSSILSLNTSRLIMEVNYMLSYGAAERSLSLLRRYHLLEFLFPIQNAYLSEQSYLESAHDSLMLMRLFSNLDKLVSCDRPSECTLWLAILAFHIALIKDPQHPLVVLAFASLLYHGKWEEGIRYARGHVDSAMRYNTEILDSGRNLSDDELAERITEFISLVKDSVDVLTYKNSLLNAMVNFPGRTCCGFVFVSPKMGRHVQQVFDLLVKEGASVTSLNIRRKSFKIDYSSLGGGYIRETSFVLGKIIIDTMVPAGVSDNVLISKEKDGRKEINPRPELEFPGDNRHEVHSSRKETIEQQKSVIQQKEAVKNSLSSIIDQSRNGFLSLDNILKEKESQSPQDDIEAILGDVIHASRNNEGSKKAELIHDKEAQLSARKHSKILGTSTQDHRLQEKENVDRSDKVVDRDEPSFDQRRPASEQNAEHNPEIVKSKKVGTRLSRLFN